MDRSDAGILGYIASQFPASESVVTMVVKETIPLIQGSARRVGFVVSNVNFFPIYISTDPNTLESQGWVIPAQTVVHFLVKDIGGLAMMPWVLIQNAGVPVFVSVFEILSNGG